MKHPLSPISISRYEKEFEKSWFEICLEVLSWRSGAPVAEIEEQSRVLPTAPAPGRTTRREISLSLRYAVLKRDGFRCVKCGRSPAMEPGVVLHVDRVVSWSNGGETLIENLQSLCSECNLSKSNRHDG